MAYASLSIDLKAQLANLQTGMDKAVRLAEKNAARIEKSFAAIKGIAGGIGGALAAGLGGAGFVSFIQQTQDALLAIKDLSEGTGSTIENVSALENSLRANNRTLAEAQPILVKFNGALKEADGKNGISQALAAIGLSAEELRKQDPVIALQQVGRALQGFEDDANKARIVQELFGKSVAEVIPFLNDLAEANLKATDGIREAAEEADKFEKNLAKLKAEAGDLARTLAGPVVAGLNKVFETFKGGTNVDLAITRRQIGILEKYINENGSSKALPEMVMRLNELRQLEQRLLGDLPNGGRRPPNEGGGGLASRRLPDIAGLAGGSATARGRAGGSAAREASEFVGPPISDGLRDALRAIEQTDVRKVQDLQEQLAALLNLRTLNGSTPALAEAITDVSLAIDELNAKTIAPSVDIKSDFLRSEKAGYEETDEFLRKLKEQAAEVESIANDLGLTFSSAFEDAIVSGKGFREVLAGIEQDILRIITRELVTKPVADGISGLVKGAVGGGGITGFLSSLFSGLPSFAVGTDYVPRDMVARIHKGERIVPAAENQGGGGRGMTVVQNFNFTGSADRATQAQVFAAAARGLAAAQRNN